MLFNIVCYEASDDMRFYWYRSSFQQGLGEAIHLHCKKGSKTS